MLKTKVLDSQTNTFYEKVLVPKPGRLNECLIGRHSSCDLVLNSPEVSRVHCRVLFWRGQCYFADLGSTDGSRLNNEEVQINHNYLLKREDTLRIGNFVLLVEEIDLTQQPADAYSPTPQTGTKPAPSIPQWTQGELSVRCVQIIEETQDVKTFRFVADPMVLFKYKPGQFVTLNLNIDGKPVKRSYSISSSPSRPHTLDITVKRVASPTDAPAATPGLVSNWLHDHVTVGTKLRLNGPFGKFTCINPSVNPPVKKLLFLSAGSGITPMMSMTQWLCDTVADADIVFFHSARSPENIIFQSQLQLLSAHHPNFKLAITTTRPAIGQPWFGYTGHLNQAMLQTIAPDFQERLVYVCGPQPFMDATKGLLTDLSFPMNHYFSESFGPVAKSKSKAALKAATDPAQKPTEAQPKAQQKPAEPTVKTGRMAQNSNDTPPDLKLVPPLAISSVSSTVATRSPSIVFTKSGKEVNCDAEDCILEVAEQENIDIPSGCRVGVCGACKRKVIEGEVTYAEPPTALKDTERQQGLVLSCIAHPIGRVVLEA